MFRTFVSLAAAATAIAFMAAGCSSEQTKADQPAAPVESGYAPVNGGEVYYAVYGQGDPLVLLHGGFGSMEMFGPVIDKLAENHSVIGMDLQAHGRTLPMDRPITFESMADDVSKLIEFLDYGKADVMGYSTGGGVALRLAIDHPEMVNSLVLVSTPYAFSGWHDYNANGMKQIAAAPEQAAEGMKQSALFQEYATLAPDPDNWTRLFNQMGAFIANDYDFSSEIRRIRAPTLLVAGDWDGIRGSHVMQFFELLGGNKQDANWDRSGLNQNRLAILPNTTHYEIFSSPELARTVDTFLDAQVPIVGQANEEAHSTTTAPLVKADQPSATVYYIVDSKEEADAINQGQGPLLYGGTSPATLAVPVIASEEQADQLLSAAYQAGQVPSNHPAFQVIDLRGD